MKLSIGCDHAGVHLKEVYKYILTEAGYTVTDHGCNDPNVSVDYPDVAKLVCKDVTSKEVDYGILICGSGIGMSIAANRYKGIRASLVHNMFTAKVAREHNNANLMCIGARVVGEGLAIETLRTFISTQFSGGRHNVRLEKLSKLEVNE